MKYLLLILVACSTLPEEKNLLIEYKNVMRSYPAEKPLKKCKSIHLKSSKRAWISRTSIKNSNTNFSKPNFNGAYLLLESKLTNGSEWFLVDCKTGKIHPEVIVGRLLFEHASGAVIRNPPTVEQTTFNFKPGVDGYPEIYAWKNKAWELIPNPVQRSN